MEPKHLASKALTCLDEDLTIEIVSPKDENSDLFITVSITRTYLFTNPEEIIRHNGNHKRTHPDIHELHSVAI